MLEFLLSPLGRMIGIGAIAALIAGFGTYKVTAAFKDRTIDQMRRAQQTAISEAWRRGWEVKAQRDEIVRKADVAFAESQQKTVTVTQEIVRNVPVVITARQDALCHLPNGFVRLLDAAGLGIAPADLPNRTAEPDSADSGIPLSQATALLAQDLGDAAGLRGRLLNARAAWEAQRGVRDDGTAERER